MEMVNARLLIMCLLVVLLSHGCGHKQPKEPFTEEPKVTQEFKTQAMNFIEAGTATSAKASKGVPYTDLKAQVVSTNAAYDLMLAVWPEDIAIDAKVEFELAIERWDLALDLWDLKIRQADNPTEPDINRFDHFLKFGGCHLDVQTFGKSYLVKAYRGKRYLPFDSNIKILLDLAEMSFQTGRTQILKILQNEGGEAPEETGSEVTEDKCGDMPKENDDKTQDTKPTEAWRVLRLNMPTANNPTKLALRETS